MVHKSLKNKREKVYRIHKNYTFPLLVYSEGGPGQGSFLFSLWFPDLVGGSPSLAATTLYCILDTIIHPTFSYTSRCNLKRARYIVGNRVQKCLN